MIDYEQNQWIKDPVVRQATLDADRYSIPRYVYQSWRMKYHDAKQRGIGFTFTLLQWHIWWMTELRIKGHNAKRGRGIGLFMMCRIGDAGDYSPSNVYCGTAAENNADAAKHVDFAEMRRKWHETHECHLKGKRGDEHPKSRAVLTSEGRYGSIALASEAAGISRQAGFYRVRSGKWRYENVEPTLA